MTPQSLKLVQQIVGSFDNFLMHCLLLVQGFCPFMESGYLGSAPKIIFYFKIA